MLKRCMCPLFMGQSVLLQVCQVATVVM